MLLDFIKERLFRPKPEPEHEEPVEHDTVMMMIDGELREVTADDFEAEQRV